MLAAVIFLTALSAGLVALSTLLAVAWRSSVGNERKSMGIIIAAGKREIDERIKRNEAENAATHLTFELGKQTDALAAAQARAKVIEKELDDALSKTSLGDGLARSDVAGRVRKLAEAARAAQARVAIPSIAGPGVHKPAAPERPGPAKLPIGKPIDVLK
jgi:hypothetical protein